MRTLSEVIDNETENTIQAEYFFAQDEDIIFKQRYELEEAIQLNKKLWVCPICRQPIKIRGRKDGIISMCESACNNDPLMRQIGVQN
jgi:hypothetical protein